MITGLPGPDESHRLPSKIARCCKSEASEEYESDLERGSDDTSLAEFEGTACCNDS